MILQEAPPAHSCKSLAHHSHRHRRGSTYVLAGKPNFTIRATSRFAWAVTEIVVGISAFGQLGLAGKEFFGAVVA